MGSTDFQDLGDIRILTRDLGSRNFNHGGDLALCPRLGRLQGIHGQLQEPDVLRRRLDNDVCPSPLPDDCGRLQTLVHRQGVRASVAPHQGNKRRQSSSGSSYPITKRQPQEHVSPTATKLRISPAPMLMVVAPPPSARLGSPLPLEWRKTGLRTFNGPNSMSIHPHAQKKRISHRNGCVYCLHNGESADLAESHVMRHPLTKEIICPVLKEKPCKCPLDISPHTVDACPMHFGVITGNKRMNVSRKVQPRLATVVLVGACNKRTMHYKKM